MIDGIIGLIYGPSRVRYPMVRLDWYRNRHLSDTSQRGDNRFVRVGWDEALDLFYAELERIQKDYGPWAAHRRRRLALGGTGAQLRQPHGARGRHARPQRRHRGGLFDRRRPDDPAYVLGSTEVYSQGTSWEVILQESQLIVFWANDPIKNLQVGWNTETHEAFAYYEQLKQKVADKSIRVICLDPVKSKTLNYLGAEQQYVNPMTDVPLMLAIAQTLVKENLHDTEFLESYTLGFDEFLPYLEGRGEDGVEKSPEWAAAICGVPAERIRELARLMAQNRTQLIFGWAIQRQQHGEQPYWMGAVLAAMLGQIGLPGGGISYAHHYSSVGVSSSGAAMPGAFPLNLDPGRTPRHDNTDFAGYSPVLPVARVIDALLEPDKEIDFNGHKVKFPPYKMAIFSGCNQWHRQPQRNRMKEAWSRLETVVAIDYNWTATCRFADIVLPACTPYERNDLDAYGSFSNRGNHRDAQAGRSALQLALGLRHLHRPDAPLRSRRGIHPRPRRDAVGRADSTRTAATRTPSRTSRCRRLPSSGRRATCCFPKASPGCATPTSATTPRSARSAPPRASSRSSAARSTATAMPTARATRCGWRRPSARTAVPARTATRCGCSRCTRTSACTRSCAN